MKLLNLQFSIFGSFMNIGDEKTKADELQKILGPDFFINIMPVIDTGTNPPGQFMRVRAIGTASNQGIVVGFLPDRIDINFYSNAYRMKKLEAGQDHEISVFLGFFREMMEAIAEKYTLIGTRLAINGRIITSDIPSDFRKYLNPSGFYEGKAPVEWQSRINIQTTSEIEGQAEILNNIIMISNSTVFLPDSGIVIDFDINTVPSNQRARFSKSSLGAFSSACLENLLGIIRSYGVGC